MLCPVLEAWAAAFKLAPGRTAIPKGKTMQLAAPATLLTAAVTLLTILIAIGTAILVARTRRTTGIQPPAMSGDPRLERALRVQGNTVEGFIIFLPALWLAALYFQGWAPPIIGLVWCLGRIFYAVGYVADAERRHIGFGICIFSVLILVILAAIGIFGAWTAAA
jgi:glutathione S-transferase